MNADQAKQLRAPFPPAAVGKLPKPYKKESQKGNCNECGGYHGLPAIHLDYVGHAAVTDLLLKVDPEWNWEPVAFDQVGLPAIDSNGGLWIKLTIAGVTRYGYGHADGNRGGDATKTAIGDALRNAAMRFGVALDLWSKENLNVQPDEAAPPPKPSPLQEARDRVWAEAQRLGWDSETLAQDYAREHGGEAIANATASELNEYAVRLEVSTPDVSAA